MSKYFKVTTDKSPIAYKVGEKIVFSVSAQQNCCEIRADFVRWTLEGDDGQKSRGSAKCPFTVETSLSRPGFVHLICTAYDSDNNPLTDFDVVESGAGAEIEKIPYCGNVPADYDEFWDNVCKEISDFDTYAIRKEPFKPFNVPPKGCEDYLCYSMEINTPCKRNATGYLTMPSTDGKYPLIVSFPGYTTLSPYPEFKKDFIQLHVGAHGFEIDILSFDHFDKYGKYDGYGFDEEENKDPKTAYWYDMIVRDLCATKYAKSLPQWNGEVLISQGGSQGGFRAINVAAHDPDVTGVSAFIPWFANLHAKEYGYCDGWRPKPANGLEYFDTALAASRVKCPAKIDAYLGDYCCPPSTVTSIYNNMTCEKILNFTQSGTHGYRPAEPETYSLINNADFENGQIKCGKYRHFKGGLYELLFCGAHSETHEEFVVYRSLSDGKVWTRPTRMWCEEVVANGKQQKRFEFIG